MEKLMICLVVGLLLYVNVVECKHKTHNKQLTVKYSARNCRRHTASMTDFGGVGDGKTLNTKAFKAAIANLSKFASDGGALLFVPKGTWLTGSFYLTSHFTLYIHKDAVLLASQDESDYPVIEPLPSYGIGRDGGKRYASLIMGTNLTVEVIIEHVTIIAPVDVPNTDGINPDSCTNTRIRDSYIVSGDDCIAVKSGWDEYGIKFGMPTVNLSIKRLTCISPDSAVIALGSEMSGGIQSVRAENIIAINSESGVRIKTANGRGAYVKDIYVQNISFNTIKYVFWMTGAYGSHPDSNYDPKALPKISNINYRNVVAKQAKFVGNLSGIEGDPFTGICISNVTAEIAAKKKKPGDFEFEEKNKSSKLSWNCTNISGVSSGVVPAACPELPEKKVVCPYPKDTLAIDAVVLQTCSIP